MLYSQIIYCKELHEFWAKKTRPELYQNVSSTLRQTGLEPAQALPHKHLKLACLPIPPLPRIKRKSASCLKIHQIKLFSQAKIIEIADRRERCELTIMHSQSFGKKILVKRHGFSSKLKDFLYFSVFFRVKLV